MARKAGLGARERILVAADELARDVGPSHLSLEAVAARAGVSKGGLLYHFPSKSELMTALVVGHLERFRGEIAGRTKEHGAGHNSLLRAYLEVFVAEQQRKQPPPSGVLAAMLQDPQLMEPIGRFKRDMLDRLKADATDEANALVLFLALEGLRSLKMFDVGVLSDKEERRAVEILAAMVTGAPAG